MNKKFRVYDDKTKTFSFFDIRHSLGHIPNDIPDNQIQQFTGMLDKNGREIYEGDIVLIEDNWKVEVKFINDFFAIPWPDDNGDIYLQPLSYCPQSKIIGNIFENANLLNG